MSTLETTDDFTKEIVYLIRRLMQASERYTKELNKKYSVSAPQLACLVTLADHDYLSPSQIARNILELLEIFSESFKIENGQKKK